MKCYNDDCDWQEDEPCLCPKCGAAIYDEEVDTLRARVAELSDKALRFDLDQAGITAREREAVELVELRARVAELEQERNEARSLLSTVNSSDYSLGLLVRELRARVAELEKDAARLAALECLVDGIGGIDIHEEAAINASAFGHDEPNRDDYLSAIRTAIDAAMKEGK